MNDENELICETSPYLLQHAHNPVHWKAWNEHTLALAQKENKPMLISIGYAACHWCHVMEKETFEDKEAAGLMNRNFICVKVDREERPDVDQVYMTAAQLINGNGGWPLNAFALPDGRPFYAATYFPRDRWMNLLEYFIQQFKEDREFLQSQAESISKGIHDINRRFFPGITSAFSSGELKRIRENVLDKIDPVFGGILGKMKFPMASVWELLLELYVNEKDENILKATEQTLLHMANGGINDHLGGGFARYASDEKWMIPHFEKMLYDNAQLISLYSHAFQVTQNPVYKKVVEETIDFVLKELKAPKGYYASLDADSNGKEGEYYVWSYREISEALGEESSGFIDAFGITPGGNFDEAKNVLYRVSSDSWGDSRFDRSRSALLKIRDKRKRPALDDKVLTSWNAMMSVAFADAGCAFQNDIWIEKAKEILDFLLTDLLGSNNELYRNYQKGTASTHAFLDDYAFLIKALIRYYQATFEISYLDKAKELTVYILEHYYHPEIKMCFYNDKRFQGIFTRLIESTDDVIPSSNAVMAENLFMLGTLYDEADWIKIATDMVKNVREDLVTQPVYYSSWARLMIRFVKPPYEVAIAGQKAPEMIKAFRQYFLPECVFCGDVEKANLSLLEDKFQQGKSWIYVCSNRVCQLPVATVSEALDQILKHRKQ